MTNNFIFKSIDDEKWIGQCPKIASRKKQLFLFVLGLVILLLPACKKYEDGPLISFRTPERRLQGRYHAEVFAINGQDALQFWKDSICSNYFELWYEEGTGRNLIMLYFSNTGLSGYYNLNGDKKYIDFTIGAQPPGIIGRASFASNTSTKWKITKLSNKRLHLSTRLNGTDYYLELDKFMDSSD